MWWGDLVTLAWWDDLWLSESFATFVGNKIEHALHPEWGIWRDFVIGTTRGFAMDALVSTHAIHADAEDAAAALQRVDAITYQKGAAVLRMLEAYLGEDVFRAGVRLYLERFREATAVAADFWRALDEASGLDVTRVAEAWITQPGHPVVELAERDGRLALRQRQFLLDPEAPPSARRWPVPLVLRTPAGQTRHLFDSEVSSVDLPEGAWLHPNSRAAGFYRFSLDRALRARLLAHLGECSPEERLLVLDNEWALLLSGAAATRDHVALLRALAGERDRAVLAVALEQLQWLAINALPEGVEAPFGRLVEAIFRPVIGRLGFDAPSGEDDDDAELRAIAIRALGMLAAAADVRTEAAARVSAHLDGRAQDPNLVAAFAAVAAVDGGAELHARYVAKVKAGEPQEVPRFRPALATFRDEAATRATIACVDDHTIRDQDLNDLFWNGYRNRARRAEYWRAFRDRYAARFAPLEGILRSFSLLSLSQLTPPDLAREADAFLAGITDADAREVVVRAREALRLQSTAGQGIGRELAVALG
jgi:puromycin-sensitive aminopeptidase